MVPFERLGACGFLFAFHSNKYGLIFSRFDTIHERDGQPATQPPHESIASRGKNERDTVEWVSERTMDFVLRCAGLVCYRPSGCVMNSPCNTPVLTV